jgi:hypothetical protein
MSIKREKRRQEGNKNFGTECTILEIKHSLERSIAYLNRKKEAVNLQVKQLKLLSLK